MSRIRLVPLLLAVLLGGCAATGGTPGTDRALLRAEAGDLEGAVGLAEEAFADAPSENTAAVLRDLRSRLAVRLRADADAALAAGDPLRAEDLLAEAQELDATEDGRRRLADVRQRTAPLRARRFAEAATAVDDAIAAGDWVTAADAAAEARRHGSTEASRRAERFATAMVEAEAAADAGDLVAARLAYDRAVATGLRREAVLARRAERIPLPYAFTVHAAAILPFSPGNEQPWDGPPVSLDGPTRLLSLIAALIDAETFGIRIAVEQIVRWTQQSVEAPDCAVSVVLGGSTTGGPDTAVEDTFHPVWDLRVVLRGTTQDGRILRVRVDDIDLQHDDTIGAWTTTVGELLRQQGVREIALVDREGRPLAGGIVGLRLSVEPIEAGDPEPSLPR